MIYLRYVQFNCGSGNITVTVNGIKKSLLYFQVFNVLDTQPSEALMLTADITQDHLLIWLALSNIFIGALLIVVLSLCVSQRKSFKRQLRAVCLNAYGRFSYFPLSLTESI